MQEEQRRNRLDDETALDRIPSGLEAPTPSSLVLPAVPERKFMKRYVLGLLFDPTLKMVTLIQKQKPAWQKGKFNGIGGKIEDGETPLEAMVREYEEETGLRVEDWKEAAHLTFAKDERGNHTAEVFLYYTTSEHIHLVRTTTSEEVRVLYVQNVPGREVVPNIVWMMHMCLSFYRGEMAQKFYVEEVENVDSNL